jgi:Ca-activated chloride channel family protein
MTTLPTLLAALGLAVLAAGPAFAETGALTALGPDGAPRAACPLRHTDVRATVSGFVARVVVTQEFTNPLAEPIEALYTFPLSERGAVDAMEMRTGERVIRGSIKEREEARRIYEAARAAGKLAGLLDQERPNVFTQTIANLLPGATVTVRIEYVEPLVFEAGQFSLSVPTVVGPRFNPPGLVPDAGAITPPITPEGTRAGHDIAIAVDIDAGVPIGAIDSRLHEIDVERPGPMRAAVRLAERAAIPNRDFVLAWTVGGDEVRSTVLTHRRPGEDGYATFVLVPPAQVATANVAPKELIFVVDRSGSQSGLPLMKAKETLHWILDHLHSQDTFQIVSFSNQTEMLFERPQAVTLENVQRARTYIDALDANGGTYMADAVERVCQLPADGNRLRIVTFMTDGYVGNDFEVLGLVRKLRGTSRWFAFGTGNSVNRFLIDGMARLGGGEAEYVLLNEPGEVVAQKFWQRIGSPVLTDVRLEFEGLDVVQALPAAPADVWAERPLVVQARYQRAGRGRVVLRGFRQGRPYEQALDVVLPERADANAAIASMWARAQVDDLMAQDLAAMQNGNFPAALRTAIIEVALAHRLVTQFTSFVAVEERVVNEGGRVRTVEVPVEMPQGVRYEGILGADRADPGAAQNAAVASPQVASGPLQWLGMGNPRMAGRRAAKEAPSALAFDEVRAVTPPPPPLEASVRAKLTARLVQLLEAGRDPGDGWLRLTVTVADERAATIRGLEALGLRATSVAGRTVVGVIARDAIARLAGDPAVVAIDLAAPASPR